MPDGLMAAPALRSLFLSLGVSAAFHIDAGVVVIEKVVDDVAVGPPVKQPHLDQPFREPLGPSEAFYAG